MDGLERMVTMDENTNVSQVAQNEPETTPTEPVNNNTEPAKQTDQVAQNEPETDIEKLIQRAVDRATNKLGNENKKLRDQNEALKREKLTDAERKQLELADKEADIADREAKLKDEQNRWFAMKAIKDAGLDDGGTNALELVEFVMGDDEDTITAKVKTFETLVKKLVSAEVDRTFKANGRNPEKGGSGEANTTNNVAINLGKTAAERNAAANNVLSHYLGGK